MTGREAVLGIDAGTTACKAVVFSTDGTVLGIAHTAIPLDHGAHGEVTSDMNAAWEAAATATREAVAAAGDVDILAACVTGQGDGAWWVDAHDHPVGPAALWLDARAADDVDRWRTLGWFDRMKDTTGSPPFPGALPMLVAHAMQHEPARMDATAWHLNCKDWIRLRMTGVIATDATDASRTYLDPRTGAYSQQLLNYLGQEHMADRLPPIRPAAEVVGRVTPHASAALGIPAGTPVVTGMMDTVAGGVGMGALDVGDTYAVLGTTAFVGTIIDSADAAASDSSTLLATGTGASVLECMSPMNGIPNLTWARDMLGWGDLDWTEVERRAASAPAGSDAVFFLPYVATAGERAPFVDPHASAGWIGARVTTAHESLMRAAYESVAFVVAECLDHLAPAAGDLRVCGGGASSDFLCQLLATITHRTVVRVNDPEVGARGAAALALAGASGMPIATAVARMAVPTQRFSPRAEDVEFYAHARRLFVEARDHVRPAWHALAQLRDITPSTPPRASEEEYR